MMVLAVVVVGCCVAAALVRSGASSEAVLFQNPSTAEDDPDSWTIQGILDDGIDGETGSDPFKLDAAAADREARRKVRLGLRLVGAQRTQMLLGGDDWLGAPFAVPEDVRENGEQRSHQSGRDPTTAAVGVLMELYRQNKAARSGFKAPWP